MTTTTITTMQFNVNVLITSKI